MMATAVWPDVIRIASWTTELSRKGPGLLLRDMRRGDDPQIAATLAVLKAADADIIALQGLDWDQEAKALRWLAEASGYEHIFTASPNSGLATPYDLNGDGKTGGAADAQGWGRFHGDGGLAILSRFPVVRDQVRDLSPLLWVDLPDATLPQTADGTPFPDAQAQAHQRLPSTAHWVVPLDIGQGQQLVLLTFHATPPVFDGLEDRNGLRNADEIALWSHLLADRLRQHAPMDPVVLAGNANLDPEKGAGRRHAIRALLTHPALQDPMPEGADGANTVDWAEPTPGNMRVSYVLPDRRLTVTAHGVFWPPLGDPLAEAVETASRHRLVWVEIERPP